MSCTSSMSRKKVLLLSSAVGAPAPADARAHAAHVAATLDIVQTVLGEAAAARAAWARELGAAGGAPAPAGPRDLLPALVALVTRALTQTARNCPDSNVKWQVCEAAGALADRLLSGAAASPSFERLRRDLLRPFADAGLGERATTLAEKFEDYELLVDMCIDSDDFERMYDYIEKYPDEGVAELAFARTLRALHALARRQYCAGAAALAAEAAAETASVGRMTTMASLGKLCLLATDETAAAAESRAKIESCLALAAQHEALPRDIRLRHGLDDADTAVMQPEDLVQMYVESESKALTEYDYKKALDLTDFVADMERRDELRLRVWCASVLRDEWDAGGAGAGAGAPTAELSNKTFFRLIELVQLMGGDLELVLPPAEDVLTAPELADVMSDRMNFLIKYGYQCLAQPCT